MVKRRGKHFILTSGRSGSNYLVNILNKHPNIVNYGEVLGKWTTPYKLYKILSLTGVDWCTFVDYLYNSITMHYAAQFISIYNRVKKRNPVDFKNVNKVFSTGMKDFAFLIEKRDLIEYLSKNNDIKVIHLHRRNLLKRYLSLVRMEITGIVKSVKNINKEKMYVDINDMLEKIEIFSEESDLEFKIAKNIPDNRKLTVYYEDFFLNSVSIRNNVNRIFNFLEVNPILVESEQKKVSSDNLANNISNFNEVVFALKGTKYEKFLSSDKIP